MDRFLTIPQIIRDYALKHKYNQTSYVRYLQIFEGDLMMRTFGFRDTIKEGFELTEIERRLLHKDGTIRRNCYLTSMSGYRVVYRPQTHANSSSWYGYYYSYFDGSNFDKWFHEPKQMGIYAPVVNKEMIFDIDKYKYCGYSSGDLFEYLLMYEQDPKIEYFGKLGIYPAKTLTRKAAKDKGFMKFLVENPLAKNERPQTIIYAYEHNKSFNEARSDLHKLRGIKTWMKGISKHDIDLLKLYDYAISVGVPNYRDYYAACQYLGLDMTDTKNSRPYDFATMHDLRINEYESKKAHDKSAEEKKLDRDFKKKAAGLQELQFEKDGFVLLIPKTTADLRKEGRRLHHCVGKMGYDKKMLKGECVIGFIRMKGAEDKPIATVEYLTNSKIISQCYGDHDSRPEKEVREFAEAWAKEIKNREILKCK